MPGDDFEHLAVAQHGHFARFLPTATVVDTFFGPEGAAVAGTFEYVRKGHVVEGALGAACRTEQRSLAGTFR